MKTIFASANSTQLCLEEQSYAICESERDFMPGTTVADNIEQAIQTSRKIIILLSR